MNTEVIPTPKECEFILAIDKSFFDSWSNSFLKPVNSFSTSEFLDSAQKHVVIREKQLDCSDQMRMIVPYVIVSQRGEDGVVRYFPTQYQLTPKGSISIGSGCAIGISDIVPFKQTDLHLQKTVMSVAHKLYRDRIQITPVNPKLSFSELVNININYGDLIVMDAQHGRAKSSVGIIMELPLPAGFDVKSRLLLLRDLPPASAEEILSSGEPLDPWAQRYLEYVTSNAHHEAGDASFTLPA